MKLRILTAAWLLPLALCWMFLTEGNVFVAGACILCVIAAQEWGGFVGLKGAKSWLFAAAYAALLAGCCTSINPFCEADRQLLAHHDALKMCFAAGCGWWIIAIIVVFGFPKSAIMIALKPFAWAAGMLTLIPFFFSIVWLHEANPSGLLPFASGGMNLFFAMLLVWCADTGAYFAGRSFGKHKMLEAVSPKKTMEGLAGGLLLSLLVAVGVSFAASGSVSLPVLGTAATVSVIASVLGDLLESAFKRTAGIKDSGWILPGHGGVMDRVDSLTAALPVYSAIMIFAA